MEGGGGWAGNLHAKTNDLPGKLTTNVTSLKRFRRIDVPSNGKNKENFPPCRKAIFGQRQDEDLLSRRRLIFGRGTINLV